MFKFLKLKYKAVSPELSEKLTDKERTNVATVSVIFLAMYLLSMASMTGTFVSLVGFAIWQAPAWLFLLVIGAAAVIVFFMMLKSTDKKMASITELLQEKYRDQ